MAMVCGAETTPEEDFLYSEKTSKFLDQWEAKASEVFGPPGPEKVWARKRARAFLETFAWAVVLHAEED